MSCSVGEEGHDAQQTKDNSCGRSGVLVISAALAPKTNASPPPSEMTQPASTQLIDAMKNGFPYVVDTTNRTITIATIHGAVTSYPKMSPSIAATERAATDTTPPDGTSEKSLADQISNFHVNEISSQFTKKSLESGLIDVENSYTNTAHENDFIAYMYEPSLDKIVVYADPDIANQIAAQLPSDTHQVFPSSGSPTKGRLTMGTPVRGGGKLKTSKLSCTSGIVATNTKGTRGVFTAAHCFNLRQRVLTGSGSYAGTVTHSYTYPNVDAEFISGSTYSASIFTGGNQSTKTKLVRGEYFPTAGVGNRVCFVGITSGENCGNQVHMYNANTCGWTPTGSKCVRNVIALTGGTTSHPGDSGGTVFANFGNTVKVTGIVQGHKNSTWHGPMTFITDWRSIKSSYKAKLVLG